jgi:hypothetical protein
MRGQKKFSSHISMKRESCCNKMDLVWSFWTDAAFRKVIGSKMNVSIVELDVFSFRRTAVTSSDHSISAYFMWKNQK